MVRVDWAGIGERFYEAGIDRGMLYVKDVAGVPWIGLVNVTQGQSGGQPKPIYLDGIKISNRASPEEFEGTIQAFTYPTEFESCDGTARVQNGLKVTQQRRHSFHMAYRSRVGNDVNGLDFAYKIHILYNLRAEPSELGHRTLSDQNEPALFNWRITSRAPRVQGLYPSAHYVIDSRDVPAELLEQVENILYGDSENDPSLPTPGELVFLFDAFEDLVYDAGTPYTPVYETYDGGSPGDTHANIIDGGAL